MKPVRHTQKIVGLLFCLLLVALCAFAAADVALTKKNFC